MLLGRRKSGLMAESAPNEADATPRPRNRLSKPPSLNHNLKSASASALSLQDPESRRKAASTDSLDSQAVKIDGVGNSDTACSVSDLVSRFEASQQAPSNSSHHSLLSLPKERNSFRNSLNSLAGERRPSLQTTSSKDRLAALKNDSRTSLSPSPTFDDSANKIRFSRRSSHAPGVATRKSSVAEAITEEKEPSKQMDRDALFPNKPIDEDARSFDEGDDENWLPPPAVPRAETPQSLDYTHLGSMGWGSLQVTNGRASPAPSNMSKQLFMRRPATRDTSSEYGDVETGEQHHRGFLNSDSVYSTRNRYRDFSWQTNDSSKLQDEIPPIPGTENTSSDPATFLASEYMAELPQSPYAERQSSYGYSTEQAGATGLESSEELKRSSSAGSVRSYESIDVQSNRSSSPVPSVQSNTGSVLRTTTKRTEMDDELFEDEALGLAVTNDRDTPESWHSWGTPDDPRVRSNQGFESALEYVRVDDVQIGPQGAQSVNMLFKDGAEGTVTTTVQVQSILLAPEQTAEVRTSDDRNFESALGFLSPVEIEPFSQSTTADAISPEPSGTYAKYDSGYSSNASLKAASVEKADRISMETDRRSIVEKVFKPILKSRKTTSDVPTFKNIRPATTSPQASTTSVPMSLDAEIGKPKKTNKLTKKLPLLRRKQPIVLQTIQSIDDLSIPPVPAEATANLQIRAQAVPELQTTYSSMHHVRNRNSVSTVGLDDFPIAFPKDMEIRFPSPEPERPSQQRRRSWFGKPKDDILRKPSKRSSLRLSRRISKRNSQEVTGISEQHAMAIINGFDEAAPSLGGTPYDQIPSRRNSQLQSVQRPVRIRQRSSMDAKTAVEHARRRSASIRERDAWKARKPSTSDRPGTPGKPKRSTTQGLLLNVPPVPDEPLPPWEHRESPLEIPEPTSAPPLPPVSYEIPEPAMPPPPPPHSPRPSDVEQDDYCAYAYSDDAPPPPPHSPQPMDLEHGDYFADHEGYDEEAPAPPPPSHSPRPMDISDEDPWAAQAAAWAARRQQAAFSHDQYSPMNEEDDVYPTIPLRHEPYRRSAEPNFDGYHYGQPRPQKRHTFDVYQHNNSHSHQYESRGRLPYEQQQQQPRFYDRSLPSTPARSRDPSPRSAAAQAHSRPHSRSPAHSRGTSPRPSSFLAPASATDSRAPRLPSPAFSRYSGGLDYEFDRDFGGLGGSAGTRDSSQHSRGDYKSVDVRFAYGVDLGDVPVGLAARG